MRSEWPRCRAHCRVRQTGTIKAVSASDITGNFSTAYSSSKWGLEGVSRSAAYVYADWGIRCNTIQPGFIETNMTALLQFMPEATQQNLMKQIPMGRMGKPVEIANTALFLASSESSYFTGEILHPDGGFYTE